MPTERQLAANRANAQRSTGPKTSTGRYASSRNAVRHGLASPVEAQQTIAIDIDDLADALVEQVDDEAQVLSARQVVRAHVELLRVRAVRAALLDSFDPKGCNFEELRRLFALERYERNAQSKRKRAAKALCSI